MGKWTGGGGWGPFRQYMWTYTPYLEGHDNVNLPPPAVAATATRGPVYHSTDGHTYRTWIVDAPVKGYPKQTLVDWREKLDITNGDPTTTNLTPGQ
jgi:hypothetical protein